MASKQTVGELVYKLSGDIKELEGKLEQVEKKLKSTGKSFHGLSLKSIAAFTGIGISIASVGKVLIGSIQKAAEFESTISDLRTLIGDDAAGVQKMSDGIRELTRIVPKTAEELGSAAYDVLSAGITDASDALEVLKSSGKLAVAGLGNTKEAVGLVTSAMNAFKIPAEDADQVANTFFSTVRAGKTTVVELASSFGNAAAGAVGAGVTFNELQAATAALTVVGFGTATAQDRLRALFDELTRSSGKLSTAIKKVGISDVGTTIKSDGFKSILDKLFESTGNNEVAFKNMFSSVEAGGAALQLVTGASDDYNDTLEAMLTSTGDLDIAFTTQADTVNNKYILAQSALNDLMRELATQVLPTVNAALTAFLDLLNEFRIGQKIVSDTKDELVRLTARSNILEKTLELAKKGQSEFSESMVQTAIDANEQQGSLALLKERYDLLGVALNGTAVERRSAKKELKVLNDEMREWQANIRKTGGHLRGEATQTEFYKQTQQNLAKVIENVTLEYEKNKQSLDAVLEPSRKLAGQLETTTEENESAEDSTFDYTSALKEQEKAVQDAAKQLTDFQGKMVGFVQQSQQVREALEKNLTESFKKFGDSLSETLNETSTQLAGIVVDAQSSIEELQNQITTGVAAFEKTLATVTDGARRQELQADEDARKAKLEAEIAEQQKILDTRVGFEERQAEKIAEIRKKLGRAGFTSTQIDTIAGLNDVQILEEQIAEKKRFDALDEFAQFEELQFKKLDQLTTDFLTEVTLTEGKIRKQKDLESDLTTFLQETNDVRIAQVDSWAEATMAKYNEVAESLRSLLSLQTTVSGVLSNSQPQFHDGGHVGAAGGQVHAGEYVIPSSMVSRMSGLVSSLERARQGGSISNSKTVNAPITMNNSLESPMDMRTIGREIAFEMRAL